MNGKSLLVVCLLGTSDICDALVKESERAIVTNEITAKKEQYDVTEASAAEIQRALDEKRKERNNKVKAVMRVAKKSDLPAGLFLRTIDDGEVMPELMAEQSENLNKWKKARRVPRELRIPWENVVLFAILFVIATVAVIIHRARKKTRASVS